MFWKVNYPEVGDQPEPDGDRALDDVHVLPAPVPVDIIEVLVDSIVDDATCSQDDDFTSLQKGIPELLLFASVPCRYEISETGIDARHGNSKEDS